MLCRHVTAMKGGRLATDPKIRRARLVPFDEAVTMVGDVAATVEVLREDLDAAEVGRLGVVLGGDEACLERDYSIRSCGSLEPVAPRSTVGTSQELTADTTWVQRRVRDACLLNHIAPRSREAAGCSRGRGEWNCPGYDGHDGGKSECGERLVHDANLLIG